MPTRSDLTDHRVAPCTHLDQVKSVRPSTHLCLTCGHVGCCDSSPNRHASAHARLTGHPLVRSFEPGEDWAWCYLDQVVIKPAPSPRSGRRWQGSRMTQPDAAGLDTGVRP